MSKVIYSWVQHLKLLRRRKRWEREKYEWKTERDRTHKCKTLTWKVKTSKWKYKKKYMTEVLLNQTRERKDRAERINTISIHNNEDYKGWEELVGTFSLIDPEREKHETMATVFSVSIFHHPLCKTRGGTRGKAIHTQDFFWNDASR